MTVSMYLQNRFTDKIIIYSKDPIKNSSHSFDINLNGIEIRCRHFSPLHQGQKGGIIYHPVTIEQKLEKTEIVMDKGADQRHKEYLKELRVKFN